MLLIDEKKFLQLEKLKILFHGNMSFVILMVKELLEHAMKKNCRRQIKKNLEQKNYLKKGNKLYVKQKGYDNSFNSQIDKKDIV